MKYVNVLASEIAQSSIKTPDLFANCVQSQQERYQNDVIDAFDTCNCFFIVNLKLVSHDGM